MSSSLDRLRRDIRGVLFFSASLFLALALFSYHPEDPSFNTAGVGHQVVNYCGYVGSFLADLLYQFFGLTAWIFVIWGLTQSYRIFRYSEQKMSWVKTITAFVFVAALASLCALYFPETNLFSSQISIGGGLGIVLSKGMKTVFNPIGVSVILWALTLVSVLLLTETSLRDFAGKLWSIVVYSIGKIPRPRLPSFRKPEIKVLKENERHTEPPIIEPDKLPPVQTMFKLSQRKDADVEKKKKIRTKPVRRVENWDMPKLELLEDPPPANRSIDEKTIKINTRILEEKLAQFSVKGKVTAVRPGPAVTQFEFKPNADVKISKITDLADDLSLALSSESVRIIAPLLGRDVVGIETANPKRETVYLKELIEDPDFWDESCKLPLVLGKKVSGLSNIVDLKKIPHLLVAGTTGSGKSVFMMSILTGLIMRHSPKTLRLILVDPKQVDLAAFHATPHLLMPPIKESKKAVLALKWAIKEMEKRYRSMSRFNVRNLEGFNKHVEKLSLEEKKKHQSDNEALEEAGKSNETYYHEQLPYIVVAVEEFGDLMTVDKANVEQTVVRLAQMARACGIHLVLAMQSPRRDVITGLIKTNIPGRISFKVASKLDSRIILDEPGAERLLATGDMLYLAPGVAKPERHHGAWIPENEIEAVTQHWGDQSEPVFDENAMVMLSGSGGGYDFSIENNQDDDEKDEKYDEILSYVSSHKEVSASLLQRRFRLGYPRAARLIEIMESDGVVGPAQGSKPRKVLINELK
jgi:S-DNA-T family DNA segregation ATPase FtsK/SpoIIIE